jgi:hypothetical protein
VADATDLLTIARPDKVVTVTIADPILATLELPRTALDQVATELHQKRRQLERLLF